MLKSSMNFVTVRFVHLRRMRDNARLALRRAACSAASERQRPTRLPVTMSRNETLTTLTLPDFDTPPLPAVGERWALFVDIDGTLVDFAHHPNDVHIDAATLALLARLEHSLDGALAVLSGRCLADVDRMLSPLVLPAGALHGIERRDANGEINVTSVPPAAAERVYEACVAGIQALDGVRLETKARQGFALHFRQRPAHEAAVHRLAQQVADASSGQFVVQKGNCVAELIPPGRDKGSALRALLATPPSTGRCPIMLGDDLTDESAFTEATRLGGFGIVVGNRRPTCAKYALPSPRHAVQWLERLAATLDHQGAVR
jgi:trehalose 6-phosphate phosphatase